MWFWNFISVLKAHSKHHEKEEKHVNENGDANDIDLEREEVKFNVIVSVFKWGAEMGRRKVSLPFFSLM